MSATSPANPGHSAAAKPSSNKLVEQDDPPQADQCEPGQAAPAPNGGVASLSAAPSFPDALRRWGSGDASSPYMELVLETDSDPRSPSRDVVLKPGMRMTLTADALARTVSSRSDRSMQSRIDIHMSLRHRGQRDLRRMGGAGLSPTTNRASIASGGTDGDSPPSRDPQEVGAQSQVPTDTPPLRPWTHWALTLTLLGTPFVRVNAIALIYLVLFVALCMTSTARYVREAKCGLRHHLFLVKVGFYVSVAVCVLRVLLHIYLVASDRPYRSELSDGSYEETVLRQLGFSRLNGSAWAVCRLIIPDVLVALLSKFVLGALRKGVEYMRGKHSPMQRGSRRRHEQKTSSGRLRQESFTSKGSVASLVSASSRYSVKIKAGNLRYDEEDLRRCTFVGSMPTDWRVRDHLAGMMLMALAACSNPCALTTLYFVSFGVGAFQIVRYRTKKDGQDSAAQKADRELAERKAGAAKAGQEYESDAFIENGDQSNSAQLTIAHCGTHRLVHSWRALYTALLLVAIYVAQFDFYQERGPDLSYLGLVQFYQTWRYRDGGNSLAYVANAAAWHDVVYVVFLCLVFIYDIARVDKDESLCKARPQRRRNKTGFSGLVHNIVKVIAVDIDALAKALRSFGSSSWIVWFGIALAVLVAVSIPSWIGFALLLWAFLPWEDAGVGLPTLVRNCFVQSDGQRKDCVKRSETTRLLNDLAASSRISDQGNHLWALHGQYKRWSVRHSHGHVSHPFRRTMFVQSARVVTCFLVVAMFVAFVLAFPDHKNRDKPALHRSVTASDSNIVGRVTGFDFADRATYVSSLLTMCAYVFGFIAVSMASNVDRKPIGKLLWLKHRAIILKAPKILAKLEAESSLSASDYPEGGGRRIRLAISSALHRLTDVVIRHLYIVTFAVIYVTALLQITLINTTYIIILFASGILFLTGDMGKKESEAGSDKTLKIGTIVMQRAYFKTLMRIWSAIVVYTQLIIWLVYAWVLSSSSSDQNEATILVGLPHSGIPRTFTYLIPHIVIYYSASIQLIATRHDEDTHRQQLEKKIDQLLENHRRFLSHRWRRVYENALPPPRCPAGTESKEDEEPPIRPDTDDQGRLDRQSPTCNLDGQGELRNRQRAQATPVPYDSEDDDETPRPLQIDARHENLSPQSTPHTETKFRPRMSGSSTDSEKLKGGSPLMWVVAVVKSMWERICIIVVLVLALSASQSIFNLVYIVAVLSALIVHVARFDHLSAIILDALTIYAVMVVTLLYVFQFQGVYTRMYDGEMIYNVGDRSTQPLWNTSYAVIPDNCQVGESECFFVFDNVPNRILVDTGLLVAENSKGPTRTIRLLLVETVILVLFSSRMRIQRRGFFSPPQGPSFVTDDVTANVRQSETFQFMLTVCYFLAFDLALVFAFASVALDDDVTLIGFVTLLFVLIPIALSRLHRPHDRRFSSVLLMTWITISMMARYLGSLQSTVRTALPTYQKAWIGIYRDTTSPNQVVFEIVSIFLLVTACDANIAWLVCADSKLARMLERCGFEKSDTNDSPARTSPEGEVGAGLPGFFTAARKSVANKERTAAAATGSEWHKLKSSVTWSDEALAEATERQLTWSRNATSDFGTFRDVVVRTPRAIMLRFGCEVCMIVGMIVAFARLNLIGVVYATMVVIATLVCVVNTDQATWHGIRAKRQRVFSRADIGRFVCITVDADPLHVMGTVCQLKDVVPVMEANGKVNDIVYKLSTEGPDLSVSEGQILHGTATAELLPAVAQMDAPQKNAPGIYRRVARSTSADKIIPLFLAFLYFTCTFIVYQYATALWWLPDSANVSQYEYNSTNGASLQGAVLYRWLYVNPVRPRTNASGFNVSTLSADNGQRYLWDIPDAPHAWTDPAMLLYDFVFLLFLQAFVRSLKMSRFRQQHPHVEIRQSGTMRDEMSLNWLRSASFLLLPWVVVMFTLIAVLARADLLLLVTLAMMLRILNGMHRPPREEGTTGKKPHDKHEEQSIFYPPPDNVGNFSLHDFKCGTIPLSEDLLGDGMVTPYSSQTVHTAEAQAQDVSPAMDDAARMDSWVMAESPLASAVTSAEIVNREAPEPIVTVAHTVNAADADRRGTDAVAEMSTFPLSNAGDVDAGCRARASAGAVTVARVGDFETHKSVVFDTSPGVIAMPAEAEVTGISDVQVSSAKITVAPTGDYIEHRQSATNTEPGVAVSVVESDQHGDASYQDTANPGVDTEGAPRQSQSAKARARVIWQQVLYVVLFILYLRILWTLPARYVDWDDVEGSNSIPWLIVNLLGLRYGQGIRLLPQESGEPDTPVWSSSGVGLEIILFGLILVQLYALTTSEMDYVCKVRHEKCLESADAFLYTVFPAEIEFMRNRRWAYDKGKRTAEMICGKVQRLKDTDTNGTSSFAPSYNIRHASQVSLSDHKAGSRRDELIDMARWFSDPQNFDAAFGTGVALEFRKYDSEYSKLELKAKMKREDEVRARQNYTTDFGGSTGTDVESTTAKEGSAKQDISEGAKEKEPKNSAVKKKRRGVISRTILDTISGTGAYAVSTYKRVRIAMTSAVLHRFVDGRHSDGRVVDRLDALEDESHRLCPVHGDRCTNDAASSNTDNTNDAPFGKWSGRCKARIERWSLGQLVSTYCFVSTEVPCVVMLFVCALYNASLLSVVYAWSWFLLGMFCHPFPTRQYWQGMIYYTEACLLFRYFCNLPLYGSGSADWTSPDYTPGLQAGRTCSPHSFSHGCDSFARVVGCVRQSVSDPVYVSQLIPEAILLLFLCYHRSALRRMGKWGVDLSRLQELTSRRRDTIVRDKKFLLLEPAVADLYNRAHPQHLDYINAADLDLAKETLGLFAAHDHVRSDKDAIDNLKLHTLDSIHAKDQVFIADNLRKVMDRDELDSFFLEGPRVRGGAPPYEKGACQSSALGDRTENGNASSDVDQLAHDGKYGIPDHLDHGGGTNQATVNVKVREGHVGTILRQEFDLPNALKWSDLEVSRLLSFHLPRSDGGVTVDVFRKILHAAARGTDTQFWEDDAKEQLELGHHCAEDIYRSLYEELKDQCLPEGMLTRSNLQKSFASLGLSLGQEEAILFTDSELYQSPRDIGDGEFRFIFPDGSWSALLSNYSEKEIVDSARAWLLDKREKQELHWKRIRGQWRRKVSAIRLGGGLDPSDVLGIEISESSAVHNMETESKSGKYAAYTLSFSDVGNSDALVVRLLLVSQRAVDKLSKSSNHMELNLNAASSPALLKSTSWRPNESIGYPAFVAGLTALMKVSPLRFASSGLLADLYSRLYRDESDVLDVIKETFVKETHRILDDCPTGEVVYVVDVSEQVLRDRTRDHFRRLKAKAEERGRDGYFAELLDDKDLHKMFIWYAAVMAPKIPELRGLGIDAWGVALVDNEPAVDDVQVDERVGVACNDAFADGGTSIGANPVFSDDVEGGTQQKGVVNPVAIFGDDSDVSDLDVVRKRSESYLQAVPGAAPSDSNFGTSGHELDGEESARAIESGAPNMHAHEEGTAPWHDDGDSPSSENRTGLWDNFKDWQELSVPRDWYFVELICDVIMLIMYFPIWGTTAFISANQRFDSKITQGGADSEAAGSFVITYTELALLLRQFILIVLGRILFARRWTSLKLAMHVYRTLELFIITFFVLPAYTGLTFHGNVFVLWIFAFTMVYLFASGRQIRTGYPTHGYSMDVFTKSASKPMYYIWTVYRAIPFMVELKVMWDWVVSPTSLTLLEWFKLEDINAQLHKNRMDNLSSMDWTGTTHWYMRGRDEIGKPMPNVQKLIYAAIAFFLLVIVWLPLILIPIANENSEPNVPSSTTITVSVNWDRTVTASGAQEGFVSTPVVIYEATADPIDLTEVPFSGLQSSMAGFDSTGFASLYETQDIAAFAFPSFSPRRWDVSPTLKEELTCAVANNLTLSVTYDARFTRNVVTGLSAESVSYRTEFDIYLWNSSAGQANSFRDELLDMLKGTPQADKFTRYYHNDTSLPFALLLGKDSSASEVTSSDLYFVENQVFLSLYYQPSLSDGSSGKYWWNIAQTLPYPNIAVQSSRNCTEDTFCVPYTSAVAPECGSDCVEADYLPMYNIFSESSGTVNTAMESCSEGDGALPDEYENHLYANDNSTAESVLEQQRSRRTYIVTFNKRVAGTLFLFLSSGSGSLGVLGLYLSVVLVVGQFVRLFTQRISQRIIFEDMAQTTTLMNLVFSIFMAREAGRLRIEEELWRLLVRLYRRPRSLLDWTSLALLGDYDSATLRYRQRLFCFDRIGDENRGEDRPPSPH